MILITLGLALVLVTAFSRVYYRVEAFQEPSASCRCHEDLFKTCANSSHLTVAADFLEIDSQKAAVSSASPSPVTIVTVSASTIDITSNTNIGHLSSRKFRGNISFADHTASGYAHPISVRSINSSLGAPSFNLTGIISRPISISSMGKSTIPIETSPSQSVVSAAISSSAVLVVTETNTAGTIVVGVPITTTITSPPSAYRTSLVSNTLWHSDTTTTSGATIFPVFYSCGTLCGGDDHGLIIKGLGGDPTDPIRTGCGQGLIGSVFRSLFGCGTEFNFPPLVPFAIGVDGAPEIVRDLEDPKSTNLPSTASISMTSTSITSASMSSTGGSGSSVPSGCSTGTAFSCVTSYICPTGARVSCSATSTCSAIATGCGLTSSSSSTTPSSSPSKCVIYPTDGLSQSQTSDLASLLTSKLGNVTQIPLDENESIFVAFMNSSIVNDLKEQPMVSLLTSIR